MAPGAEPLSIESLLQKQKEEREAAARVSSFPHGVPIVISLPFHSPSSYRRRNVRRSPLLSEPKKYKERRERKRKIGKTGNNSSARQKLYEDEREKASTQQVTVQDVDLFLVLMLYINLLIVVAIDDDHHDRERNRDRDRGRGTGRRDHRDRRINDAPDRRSGYNNVPTEPRAERAKASTNSATHTSGGPQSVSVSSSSTPAPESTFTPPMTDEDLAALRSRYLGVDKKKRKIRKMNDRKFVFDWDEQEDTGSADPSANIGVQRQGAQVMFGRGHIAGMDDGGGSRPGTKSDVQLADAMERRKAAKHGYDDRHWTDKALDEMKERDWRIFREDFSIAARGPLNVN